MRPCLATWLLLALVLIPAVARAEPDASSPPLTPEQYVQRLDRCLFALRSAGDNAPAVGDLLNTLPGEWHVRAGEKDFAVSTNPIRQGAAAWRKSGSETSLDPAIVYLETLREDAAAYGAVPPGFAVQHARLNDILSRREFHNVEGQNWFDHLKQRILGLLITLLGRAFASSAIPTISSILIYGLIALAVLAFAYWMYRSLRENAGVETLPLPLPVSAKQWTVWMAEARLAASRGEWREAVHLAYWAGISFLEAQGAWRPDQARTPREYLRLLPPASPHQAALLALTRQLEKVWYGLHEVGADGFEQTVAELERLGCPCH